MKICLLDESPDLGVVPERIRASLIRPERYGWEGHIQHPKADRAIDQARATRLSDFTDPLARPPLVPSEHRPSR